MGARRKISHMKIVASINMVGSSHVIREPSAVTQPSAITKRELCVPWFMFTCPLVTWNKPYLSEGQFVITQHTYTAKGVIDKVLNPQWAAARCGWEGHMNTAADPETARQGYSHLTMMLTRLHAATHNGWHIYAEVRELLHPYWLIDWKRLARCTNRE